MNVRHAIFSEKHQLFYLQNGITQKTNLEMEVTKENIMKEMHFSKELQSKKLLREFKIKSLNKIMKRGNNNFFKLTKTMMSTMRKMMKKELIGRMAMKMMMEMEMMSMKNIMISSSMPPARTQTLTIIQIRIIQTHICTICLTIISTIKLRAYWNQSIQASMLQDKKAWIQKRTRKDWDKKLMSNTHLSKTRMT